VFLDDHDPFVTAAREAGLHAGPLPGQRAGIAGIAGIADIEELLGSGRYGGSGVQL
jgi:hypothetical protein